MSPRLKAHQMQPIEPERRAFDRVGISVSTSFQDGMPIKVVSERLGHSHPTFTMATYQHVLPGMQADAAARFASSSNHQPTIGENEPLVAVGSRWLSTGMSTGMSTGTR